MRGDDSALGRYLFSNATRDGAALFGRHESTVSTGTLETDPAKRGAAPKGLTGAFQAAGVPAYSGGGRLEDALSKVPPP